jgi:RNA polymerase sigma-70 factor (sigma-E family)
LVVDAAAATTGRQGTLAELYERHAPAAGRLAYLLTADRRAAEDLVQEAFVRVAGRFRHLRVPDAFEAYLRRTIVHLHTSQLRRLRLERREMERERAVARVPSTTIPDVEERDALWTALRSLPARQRTVVVLRFYEDLSERQTADALKTSPAAVKSLLARAMQTLRALIGSETDDRP